jgi:lysophospholipase L1-like esterase
MASGLPTLAAGPDGAPPGGGVQLVSASDPRFRYDGRFDFRDPASPVVIWEASTIAIDFDGGQATALFSGATDQAFFNATVDGTTAVLTLRRGLPSQDVPLPVSGSGRHHLVLFKRTEATASTVHFGGLEIAPGATAFAPPAAAYQMKMEMIGDSITAGACDEDGDKDQWDDRRTHDAAFSWAAVTAAAYSADYRNISASGIGLATGYLDVVMGQVWDGIYPTVSSPRIDPSQWTPDVVFVLLGDNDDSYPRSKNLPFPANFGEKYAALVRAIRAGYPAAHIVLLNGGMWAGIHSEALANAWSAAVTDLESKDPGISHYVFAHWTANHPRVADHRILADELITWLTDQPFMKRWSVVSRQGFRARAAVSGAP